MNKIFPAAMLASLVVLAGCKTGYNRTYNKSKDPNPPPGAEEASNPNISAEARRVFKMLDGLTCADISFDGYVMGQNAGSGNQIATESSDRSYAKLITAVDSATSHTPGLVTIDYEYDKIYTKAELLAANEKLKEHWEAGGIVGISWTPFNPWTANGSTLLYTDAVDLADLLDDSTEIFDEWTEKLDLVAEALKDLQDKGVPVLWRPLPEMNKNTYWWGTKASNPEGTNELYADLWKDMYDYLTDEKGLNNLLWVYSPGESPTTTNTGEKDVKWAYPGDDFVDLVAGIARNDSLHIKDYSDLIDLGHPVGMAEYSPTPAKDGGNLSSTIKTFDARTYVDRLHGSYKAVGFWVSWHSYDYQDANNATKRSYMALADSQYIKELTDRDNILSIERIKDKKLRD